MTDEETPYWYPTRIDEAWFARIRKDYPEVTRGLSDGEIQVLYAHGCSTYTDVWDHLGDARNDWEKLADAFFALKDELRQALANKQILEAEIGGRNQEIDSLRRQASRASQRASEAKEQDIALALKSIALGDSVLIDGYAAVPETWLAAAEYKARDDAELRDIRRVCHWCNTGLFPTYNRGTGIWNHKNPELPMTLKVTSCGGEYIYEARRTRIDPTPLRDLGEVLDCAEDEK